MSRRAPTATVVATAIAGVLSLAAGVALAIGGWDFLRQHFAALAGAALALTAIATLGIRVFIGIVRGALRSVQKPKELGQSGAVAAEFVIVVIPFLLMLFALMQLSLASLARVLVSYSAFCAARAAIVILPMEPQEVADNWKSKLSGTVAEKANEIGLGQNTRTDFAQSQKAALLRNAAAYALIPASPSVDTVVGDMVHNWPAYLESRLKNGLNPVDYLKGVLGDVSGVPQTLVDRLGDQLKGEAAKGLDSVQAQLDAKQRIDAWIDANTSSPAQAAALKAAADSFLDKAADSAKGQVTDALGNAISDVTSGPLEKFKSQLDNLAKGAALGAGGSGAGGFKGYAVSRALDVGFGSDTDGAGGAILRSLRKLVYARLGTVVTLLDEKGNIKSKFAWNDPVRARVTHLYYCQIPFANRFAGKPFYSLPDATVNDLATGPLKGLTVLGIPGYFMTLTADHTLTNQGKP
jgi:hypothetical protein